MDNKKRGLMKDKTKNSVHKKAILVLVILSLSFTLSAMATPPIGESEKPTPSTLISIDFQDAQLKDVLKILSQQSGLNFIATEQVKGKRVTLYLDKVLVQDALNSIVAINNLTYDQAPGSDIFIVKEPIPVTVEMVTRVFRLNYAPVCILEEEEEGGGVASTTGTEEEETEGVPEGDIVILIRQMLTFEVSETEMGLRMTRYLGSLAIDTRTNSIIVTDTPDKLKIIEEIIAKLDVPVPQVMIEVEVIETSLQTLEDLGFEWGTSGEIFSLTPAASDLIFPFHHISKNNWLGWPGSAGAVSTKVVKDYEGIYPGTLGTDSLRLTLDLLVTEKKVKILARPKILTLNNVTAEINVNSNAALEVKTIFEVTTQETRQIPEVLRPLKSERPGVSLSVTPTINEDRFVTMVIEPKLITKTLSDVSTDDYIIYDLGFRTAKTTVMVNDGETVIIGGLITKSEDHTLKKTPFLGDLPIVGNLFRHKDTDDEDIEIVFFITPYIVEKGPAFSRSFSDQSDLSRSVLQGDAGSPQLLSESGEIEEQGDVELKELTKEIKKELAIQQAIEKFSVE